MNHYPDKKKSHKRRLTTVILLVAIILAIGIWLYLSYQTIAVTQVKNTLANYGIQASSLNVDRLTTNDVEISDIQLGTDPSLKVGKLSLRYALNEVVSGKLQHINAKNIEANIYHKDNTWQIGGLESFHTPGDSHPQASTLSLAFDAAALRNTIPTFDAVNMTLKVNATNWQLTAPFNVSFSLPQPQLDVDIASLALNAKPYEIIASNTQIQASLNERTHKWEGTIIIPKLILVGFSSALSELQLDGTFSATSEKTQAMLQVYDASKTLNAAISLSLPTNSPDKGKITIKRIDFPWGGGTVRVKSTLPVAMNKPVPVSLTLQKVDLSNLLGEVSDGKIQGTGKVSGTIPIIYYPDGSITLEQGAAEALSTGVISVPPSLLPGDNAQLELARNALENFHYTTLKIIVSSDKEKKSVITLALQGKNPEVLEGRSIKLNVNVGGDVLPLLQQSLMPFENIKNILELQETP